MPRRPSYETLNVLGLMMARPDDDHYGLELAREAELATGTVYPILRRLERNGWVTSAWEDVDPSTAQRPRKRLYRITGLGASEARRYAAWARSFVTLVPNQGAARTPLLGIAKMSRG